MRERGRFPSDPIVLKGAVSHWNRLPARAPFIAMHGTAKRRP